MRAAQNRPPPADVVYAIDESYVVPLSVSLRSVQDRTDDAAVRITVLCDAVSARSKRQILASVPCPGEVHLVDIDGDRLPDLARRGVSTRFSRTALARLHIPPEFVDPDRFVYLDADTIVRTDIRRLLSTGLGSFGLGAVYDHSYTLFARGTGRLTRAGAGPGRCFNSGVLLVDTRWWFDARVGEQAERVAVARDVLDQGALNVVCQDSWLALDPGWNVTTQQLLLSRQFRSAPERVLIRHLTAVKPWTAQLPAVESARLLLEDFHRHLAGTVWGQRAAAAPKRSANWAR